MQRLTKTGCTMRLKRQFSKQLHRVHPRPRTLRAPEISPAPLCAGPRAAPRVCPVGDGGGPTGKRRGPSARAPSGSCNHELRCMHELCHPAPSPASSSPVISARGHACMHRAQPCTSTASPDNAQPNLSTNSARDVPAKFSSAKHVDEDGAATQDCGVAGQIIKPRIH